MASPQTLQPHLCNTALDGSPRNHIDSTKSPGSWHGGWCLLGTLLAESLHSMGQRKERALGKPPANTAPTFPAPHGGQLAALSPKSVPFPRVSEETCWNLPCPNSDPCPLVLYKHRGMLSAYPGAAPTCCQHQPPAALEKSSHQPGQAETE